MPEQTPLLNRINFPIIPYQLVLALPLISPGRYMTQTSNIHSKNFPTKALSVLFRQALNQVGVQAK